ncbi:hypothetical protein [Acinetobacter silvestris]|uniref:Uncharacterized protein n=1 Tax=Acinetobacter silvestris TaxID=1977882 RepID=A0A1Y3CFD1_9GAMM|nr:hypothetical protein [Acinetobacter silvestris]OTG65809.1 hypothetical protein B9T28_06300 [Acinetobacter silvestris]
MNAKFEIQELQQNVIVQAFSTTNGTDILFDRIAEQVRSVVPDATTRKGREEIGSLAAKISKSKVLIEKCGKDLVAEQKAQIKLIDDDRIRTVKKFDDLRNEILAPRDAWEQAEKDRVESHSAFIVSFAVMSAPQACENRDSTFIKGMISEIENTEITDALEEYKEQAKLAKFEALEALRTALATREKYESEQAELERLRQAEQIRLQQERDAQIAREATEKAQREAEEKARFEAERVQREKAESEQREARLKAEKEAAELREQALKQKAIDDAKQAEIAKQHAIESERKRIEVEQIAKAQAEIDANAAREADENHRKKICQKALADLTLLPGINHDLAKIVLEAIYRNKVASVSIKF